MTLRRLVVVGASVAAGALIGQLRADGYQGRVTVIDDDPDAPYDRPPLSKEFLAGRDERPEAPWWDGRCDFVRGRALSLARRSGTVSVAGPGGELTRTSGDHVVIATGSAPIALPGQPAGVACLRSAADARRIRAHARPGESVAIVGSGTIGTELASSLTRAGCQVTLIDMSDRPLDRFLGGHLGGEVTDWIEEAGVQLRLSTQVTAIRAAGERWVVSTPESDIPADLVISAVGTRPAVAWLATAGLDVANGVRCDADGTALDRAGAPVPNVHAIGDASAWSSSSPGAAALRYEDWTTAQRQGRHLARRLLGRPGHAQRDEQPYFWSHQFGRRIQVLGTPARDAELVRHVYEPTRRAAFYTVERDGQPVAHIAVNSPREFTAAMRGALKIPA